MTSPSISNISDAVIVSETLSSEAAVEPLPKQPVVTLLKQAAEMIASNEIPTFAYVVRCSDVQVREATSNLLCHQLPAAVNRAPMQVSEGFYQDKANDPSLELYLGQLGQIGILNLFYVILDASLSTVEDYALLCTGLGVFPIVIDIKVPDDYISTRTDFTDLIFQGHSARGIQVVLAAGETDNPYAVAQDVLQHLVNATSQPAPTEG